jgi:alpha-beta hydrolase superfamily lysophospholipase
MDIGVGSKRLKENSMGWNDKNTSHDGVEERGFDLTIAGNSVPGVYWTPMNAASERLVLLGHGGTSHKKVEYIVQVARMLAGKGIASLAIDAPGHGERAEHEVEGRDLDALEKTWHAGGGTDAVVAEWKATLDFIEDEVGARPTGWWGLSMGTMMGLPVTATDERIRVALLGLMGTQGPNAKDLERLAPSVTCPVRFLVQWDDELIPRQTCLDLFDALGSKKKTLHANPGRHQEVPQFELAASVDYLDRFLR